MKMNMKMTMKIMIMMMMMMMMMMKMLMLMLMLMLNPKRGNVSIPVGPERLAIGHGLAWLPTPWVYQKLEFQCNSYGP